MRENYTNNEILTIRDIITYSDWITTDRENNIYWRVEALITEIENAKDLKYEVWNKHTILAEGLTYYELRNDYGLRIVKGVLLGIDKDTMIVEIEEE